MTYGGDHIPKSPFNVAVAPTLDLSKVNVTGLGDSMFKPSVMFVLHNPVFFKVGASRVALEGLRRLEGK